VVSSSQVWNFWPKRPTSTSWSAESATPGWTQGPQTAGNESAVDPTTCDQRNHSDKKLFAFMVYS
jgi:hypothetical protein